MTVAFLVLGILFGICELCHFKRETELIRRLSCRDEADYRQQYEPKEPLPPPPSREAMKRWKKGE